MATKNTTYKTNSFIFVLVILGFIVVANYLITRKFARIDLTENKVYSISKASKNLVKNLDDIVNINVYFSKNLPSHMKRVESDVRDMLTEFKAYSGKNLRITWEDPSDDEEKKKKVKSMGIPEIQMQTFEKDKAQVINGFLGLAVLYADKKELIPVIQDVMNFEYDLAQCIMKVLRKEAPKIAILKTDTMPYFDEYMRYQMKGQMPPDPTEEKYKPMFQKLKENYEVKTLQISDGKPIDNAYKTIIIPGGDDRTFSERDIFEIDQFFMKGGNLIVLADAIRIDMQRGLNAIMQASQVFRLLEHYGVRVEKSMVVDASCGQVSVPQQVGPFRMNVPVNYPYITKVTAKGFNKSVAAVSGLAQMIMPWVSPLTILIDNADSSGVEKASGAEATVLVTSSENSWVSSGQFNLNPQQNWQQIFATKKDLLKPSNLIVYLSGNFSSFFEGKSIPPKNTAEVDTATGQIKIDAEDQSREIVASNAKGHLIVAGDSDFMSSQGAAPGNIAWLLNVVDWISLDENLISIRSRTLVDRTIKDDKLEAGNSYSAMIRYTNILLMPVIVIIFGLIVFFRRREVVVSSSSSNEKKETENK
jgi:gliding-associated putative ABC transporter substrate-binding component GldG